MRRHGVFFDEVQNITMIDTTIGGKRIQNHTGGAIYTEDGLILSFSNALDTAIARRLGKLACVEILDTMALKRLIDTQLGVVGYANNCQYTHDHQRNHFLKSNEDAWQEEYRMFWPVLLATTVSLPPNVGRQIELSQP
jgi:hypothetical protein